MMVVKRFANAIDMSLWLSIPTNVDNLKQQYPAKDYTGVMNLAEREVRIYEKGETIPEGF
jgi:hypothetical protein